MSCNDANGGSQPGGLDAPRRNDYYYGKLLDVLHFQMEQTYGNDKRWLLNRLSLGTGVLCGLGVEAQQDGRLCVTPGVAIDGWGREIIVPIRMCLDPWEQTHECGQGQGPLPRDREHRAGLYLCYAECATDYAPVLVSDCNTREPCAPGTIVETFRLLVRPAEREPAPKPESPLCRALLGAAAPGASPAGTTPATEGGYTVVATIPVGGTPGAVAVAADGRRALVLVQRGSTEAVLAVIDVATNTVVQELTGAATPGGVSVDPAGGPAFVTHDAGVTVVNLQSDPPRVVRSFLPDKRYGACAAAFGGTVLFAVDLDAEEVDRIDTASRQITASIATGGGPFNLAVSRDSRWLYAVGENVLAQVDTDTNAVVANTPVTGARTLAVRNAAAGPLPHVASEGNVRRVEAAGPQGFTDFPINADPLGSAFTTNGERYYVSNFMAGGGNELVVFDAEDMTEIGRVPVGSVPTVVAIVPNRLRAFVTNAESSSVSVVDAVEEEPSDRPDALCQALSGPCAAPQKDPCVCLATVQLLPGGRIGEIDACTCRPLVYSNAVLFEMILCLVARIEECCDKTRPLLKVTGVALFSNDQLIGALDPVTRNPFAASRNVNRIEVTFNIGVAPATVVLGQSFLVQFGGTNVAGVITAVGPRLIRFQSRQVLGVGIYRVSLLGSGTLAIKSTAGSILDGEPDGLPSGDGTPGGNFNVEFGLGARPEP